MIIIFPGRQDRVAARPPAAPRKIVAVIRQGGAAAPPYHCRLAGFNRTGPFPFVPAPSRNQFFRSRSQNETESFDPA
jgi:hypothetical protein